MSAIPRVVVSAPSSGHGKAAVAVGLVAAYAAQGRQAAGFKVGPDHVDAAHLTIAAGRRAGNLDPRLVGSERIAPLFQYGAAGADVAVVEGTMGLYDGLAGRTDGESTAQVAVLLRAPVLLVVDAGAMGQSVAALVHGFRAYDERLRLGGVVLNRVGSTRHERLLREALDDIGVPVAGVLRGTDLATAAAGLPGRRHGVVPAIRRDPAALRSVRRVADVVAGAVDLDLVFALARSAPALGAAWSPREAVAGMERTTDILHGSRPGARPARPLIAVAGGYGYPETEALLTAAGAEVVAVDPLHDERLPDGIAGLVVGAGLPEAYLADLSGNERLRRAVAALAAAGRPIAAEGTGMLWLCREVDGRPMCGVVDAVGHWTGQLVMGYRTATAQSTGLLKAGAQLVGYKVHHTQVSPRAGVSPAWSWSGGAPEGFVVRGVHASHLGLHWAGSPEIAARFVASAGGPATTPSAEAA